MTASAPEALSLSACGVASLASGRQLQVLDQVHLLFRQILHERLVAGGAPRIFHRDQGDFLRALGDRVVELSRALDRRGELHGEDVLGDRIGDGVRGRGIHDIGNAGALDLGPRGERRIRAAAAKEREDLGVVDELLDRADGDFRPAPVVLAHQHELAPMHAAAFIHLVEDGFDPVHGDLAVEIGRSGERAERADLDLVAGDALRLLRRGHCGRRQQENAGQCTSIAQSHGEILPRHWRAPPIARPRNMRKSWHF